MIDTALVLFAKYPQAGRVKTRLRRGELSEFGVLTEQQCADIYAAFLSDYMSRFAQSKNLTSVMKPHFCVRPGEFFDTFVRDYGQGVVTVVEEPTLDGQKALDIGEAMSFTIRHFLREGFRKVLILGSDLPHLPFDVLYEACDLLDEHPLVIGDDGGGCYLVGGCDIPEVLEGGRVTWSQGEDFVAIQDVQATLGKTVGILSRTLKDVDAPEDLFLLIEDVRAGRVSRDWIPSTASLLESWGIRLSA